MVKGLWFRVQGAGVRVQSSEFQVQGLGFKVQGQGCDVQGVGFRVEGLRDWLLVVAGDTPNPVPLTLHNQPQPFKLQGHLAHKKPRPPRTLQ